MTHSVGTISWKDTADAATPLAPYSVDFSIDPTWDFTCLGTYHDSPLQPVGVSVDGSQYGGVVTVIAGPLSVAIPAYQRLSVVIPSEAQHVVITGTVVAAVPVLFYIKDPAPGTLNQYGISVATGTTIVINGGANSGTANALVATATQSALSGLAQNLTVIVEHLAANTISGVTLDLILNGVNTGVSPVVKGANAPLAIGDIPGNHSIGFYSWDTALAAWVLLNPAKGVGTVAGTVNLGTAVVMNPVALNSGVNGAHGLATEPIDSLSYLECITAELGYVAGDRHMISSQDTNVAQIAITHNATTSYIAVGNALQIVKRDGSGQAAITVANWKLVAQGKTYN